MERRDFFVSYTNSDEEWALWITRVLINSGYSVCMQALDIFPGDSFLTKMNYFLENSENFIAVWSKPYNDSYYGMMELEAAVTARMRIIFCCVDNHPVLKLYRRLVHVALPDMSAASEAELISAVRRAVPRPAHILNFPENSSRVWLERIGAFVVVASVVLVVVMVMIISMYITVSRNPSWAFLGVMFPVSWIILAVGIIVLLRVAIISIFSDRKE